MPRQLDGTSIFRKLVSLELIKIPTGTIGDTTTTAAIIGDGSESTVAVTAITNFTAGDKVLVIGDGGVECLKIGTPATSMPVSYKPKIPQSSGARFVEALAVTLGKIAESGIAISPSKALTSIFAANDDVAVAFIDSPLEFTISAPLLEWSGLNWQLLSGFQDEETGTGSAADPYQYVIGKLNQTLLGTQVFRMTGIRHDAKYVQADFLDARVEASGSTDHNRTAPAILPVTFKCGKVITRQATAAFTN